MKWGEGYRRVERGWQTIPYWKRSVASALPAAGIVTTFFAALGQGGVAQWMIGLLCLVVGIPMAVVVYRDAWRRGGPGGPGELRGRLLR
jgi:hypothetical protein